MTIETLDARRLMSAAVASVTLDNGVLTIIGRDRADVVNAAEQLEFKRTANRIVRNDFVVTVNGQSYTFPVADVHQIVALLGKGDDRMSFGDAAHAFHKLIRRDSVIRSTPTRIDVAVYGQGGNDWLVGLDGPQLLNGGIGNDYLDASLGDDTMVGDDGNDYLIDMQGSDVLLGGYGDDYLGQWYDPSVTPSGPDHFDGGPGTDTVEQRERPIDPLISIERTTHAHQDGDLIVNLMTGFVA